jgi:hypothetical protein
MTEILAVFRSRSQAIDCAGKLKSFGVAAELINTPKEANIGCGLSVKFLANNFGRVRKLISSSNYSAFFGYYKFTDRYGKIFIARIN